MKHSFAKSSRLRVPLARVVGYNEGDWRESPPAAVAEVRLRRRNVVPRQAPGAKERIHGDATEDNHDTQLTSKSRELPFEIGLAIREFVPCGVVPWRSTSHRRGDVAISQLEPVPNRHRRRPVREARFVELAIQPVPAAVSGEHPPSPVPAMSGGCEAYDQQPGVRVPEPGNGSAPVRPVPERSPLLPRNGFAVLHQAGTSSATDDYGVQFLEGPGPHSAIGILQSFIPLSEETMPAAIRFRQVVDLSQEVGPDTQMFPGYPQPAFTQWTTREVHGFISEALFMISHTGTHIDAPWHYRPEGKRVHELPVDRFIARGHILELPGLPAKNRITPAMLRSALSRLSSPVGNGDAVLLRTGWERRRGSTPYLSANPGLSAAGAEVLVELRIGLVGVDSANLDPADAGDYPAHHVILKAGIPILENVANLAAIGSRPFHLVALPLRLRGAGGSPVRAVALVE